MTLIAALALVSKSPSEIDGAFNVSFRSQANEILRGPTANPEWPVSKAAAFLPAG